jgi:hypothetical protein
MAAPPPRLSELRRVLMFIMAFLIGTAIWALIWYWLEDYFP